jgi:hypothetical protein
MACLSLSRLARLCAARLNQRLKSPSGLVPKISSTIDQRCPRLRQIRLKFHFPAQTLMYEIAGAQAQSVEIIHLVGIDRKAIDNIWNNVVILVAANALRFESGFF